MLYGNPSCWWLYKLWPLDHVPVWTPLDIYIQLYDCLITKKKGAALVYTRTYFLYDSVWCKVKCDWFRLLDSPPAPSPVCHLLTYLLTHSLLFLFFFLLLLFLLFAPIHGIASLRFFFFSLRFSCSLGGTFPPPRGCSGPWWTVYYWFYWLCLVLVLELFQ